MAPRPTGAGLHAIPRAGAAGRRVRDRPRSGDTTSYIIAINMNAFPRPFRSAIFCLSIVSTFLPAQSAPGAAIDRKALVARHAVRVDHVDPESAVSVGNGDFAFTADVTGLQSFEKLYYDEGIPLETLSSWAWHSFPNPEGLRLEDTFKPYPFHGRVIQYAGIQDSPAGAYFRENPHPIPLGQISLIYKGRPVTPDDLTRIDQRLDLWTGIIHSSYHLDGQPVVVETTAHPTLSQVAVSIRSPLLRRGGLQVRFRFPYSYQTSVKNKPPFVWDHGDRHTTAIARRGSRFVQLERALDDSRYCVNVQWAGAARLSEAAPHDFRLEASSGETLAFTCGFSDSGGARAWPSFADTRKAGQEGWKEYWTRGGVVDLSGSADPRAMELERRIVLSQYLMKVNYAGSFPPAETGLTHVSWYGKHNTEMYFWHAAQFYQWGHTDLLEKGLAWYREILPIGKADAASKGFDGVRWPKMTGPDARVGPGTINPFIIWNQPNPIYLCELVYRARPGRATLDKYKDVVFESAKFLGSYAQLDEETGRYVLGPPIKNVSESTEENNTQNPTFELAYWHYGLQLAQEWRQRLGLEPEPHWADVLARLSKLPVQDGKYVEIETFPDIYRRDGGVPTSMLMSLGFLPQTDIVDPAIIRRTFDEVNRRGRAGILRWVSWSMGQAAMTCARLGDGETAVAILTNTTDVSASLMGSGHVRRPPHECVAYLPVNSSLLCAVGLMAAGWDGAPNQRAPGFPQDGSWTVKWEGLNPMP